MVIFLSWIVALVILGFIYPHHFFFLDRKFLESPDAGVPFVNTFALVNQFFHGGLQLFDRHDQMNYVYPHLSAGLYAIDNIVTAFVYIVCSPFMSYPAEGFHHIFSIVFYAFTALMRAIGFYLLLGFFTKDRVVIFISLVYLNTLLSSPTMYEGHISQSSFSFLPMVLYFILRFFQFRRLNDALAAGLMMTIVISNSPLFGLGYFYLIVHMFIMMCIAHAFIVKENRLTMLRRIRWEWPKNILKITGALLVGMMILLPTFIMIPSLKSDFYVAGSGIGQTEGRINNAFKPLNYFTVEGKSFANPLEFLRQSIDFEHCIWGRANWVFVGVSVLGFSLIGFVLSRNSLKHIFGWSIVLIILLNVAPYWNNLWAFSWYLKAAWENPGLFFQNPHFEQIPFLVLLMVSSLVHWLNVLTNPFSFLLRSFHVPVLFMPYLFVPLMALGLSACIDLAKGEKGSIHCQRIPWLIGFFGIILIACVYCASGNIRIYSVLGITAFLIVLLLGLSKEQASRLRMLKIGTVLAILVCADFFLLNVYAQHYPASIAISAEHIEGFPTGKRVVVEYQNPNVLAFREFGRTQPIGGLISSDENYFGLFYQFAPWDRDFTKPYIYSPVPIAYAHLHSDEWSKMYLTRQSRIIDWRDYGVDAGTLDMGNLLSNNVERRIVLVNDQNAGQMTKLTDMHLKAWPHTEDIRHFTFMMKDARVRVIGQYIEIGFKLPKDFPSYLATSVFTQDYYSWQLYLDGKLLLPVQGKLVDPYTFDVQNVRDGWLMALLPVSVNMVGQKFELRVKMPDYITDVWRNEHDQLGITFKAPRDGWMIIHYPYDLKWHLTIDGKSSSLFRVNQYFMGTPMSAGEHKVLLNYWSDTPLRWALLVSMVLMVVIFDGLIIYAFWQGSMKRSVGK